MRFVHCFRAASNYAVSVSARRFHVRDISYERDDLSRLGCELVSQFFVVRDQMCNVNVAVVLLNEHVLADLISTQDQC